MRANEFLTELFIQPYPYEQVDPTSYFFYTADERRFNVDFKKLFGPSGIFLVDFKEGQNNFGLTGKGDQFKVFATVIDIIAEWLTKNNPNFLVFTANEPSRISLYKKMTTKLSSMIGYRDISNDYSVVGNEVIERQLEVVGETYIHETVFVLANNNKVKELTTENDAEHQAELEKTGFWGKQAAGCIFMARDTGRFLIAHRSPYVQEPNTWGTWGGAIDSNEDPEQAVRREVQEEAGYHGPLLLKHLWTFKHPSGFQYHNYLAIVQNEFEPKLDWETQGYAWVEKGQWPQPLHPGLAGLLKNTNL